MSARGKRYSGGRREPLLNGGQSLVAGRTPLPSNLMQHIPEAPRLLDDIANLLENEVMGAVPSSMTHNVRVCVHLLRVVERELALGPGFADLEAHRLAAVFGAPIDPESPQLAEAVRDGFAGADAERWWQAIRDNVAADLAIAKPGYSDWSGT